MSAVAHLLVDLGCRVTGSDLRRSELTESLEARGVFVAYGQCPELARRASCVVVSSRFPKHHEALLAAAQNGVPIVDRHQMIAEICRVSGAKACLCFGTVARGKLARLLGDAPQTGWVAGAVVRNSQARHAKLAPLILVDADERDFCAHPEWFAPFAGSDVVISDWETFGEYYGEGCTLERVCDLAMRTMVGDQNVLIAPEASRPFSFLVRTHAGENAHCAFGFEGDHVVVEGRSMAYFGTQIDAMALVASQIWCRYRHRDLPQNDIDCIGWFNLVGDGRYHEIRMHPVNVRIAVQTLKARAGGRRVNVAMRPFGTTLFAYRAEIWKQAFEGVSQLAILTPPYEGCTHDDCLAFQKSLETSGMDVRCVSIEAFCRDIACDKDLWLLSGAGDVVAHFSTAVDKMSRDARMDS